MSASESLKAAEAADMVRVGSKVRFWSKSHSTYTSMSVAEEFSDGTLRLSGKTDAHIPRDQVQLVPEGVLQSTNGPDEPALGGNEDACVGAGGARRGAVREALEARAAQVLAVAPVARHAAPRRRHDQRPHRLLLEYVEPAAMHNT